MTDERVIASTEDPVCGMTVDPDAARSNGLTLIHDGTEYVFCGKGCLLEFKDDPAKNLPTTFNVISPSRSPDQLTTSPKMFPGKPSADLDVATYRVLCRRDPTPRSP